MKVLLENLDVSLVFGTLLCCALFFFAAWFCYYYNNIKLPCFLILMIFPSISTAIYFNLSFKPLSDEVLVFLIVEYLLLFSLICYKKQKKPSFFFLYLATYSLNLYCVYRVSISPILIAYVFYSSAFFLYHWYFTLTRRFILRSYSVVKVFISSYSVVKLVLWLLFVLFPALVNNHFCFFLIFNRLFLQALLSNDTTISFFLIILGLWYIFLSISSYFKMFSKVRRKVLLYFSRRACLHFVGNGFGSRLGLQVGAGLSSVLTGCIPLGMGIITYAVAEANLDGTSAVLKYEVDHPGAGNRSDKKVAFDEAYIRRIITNPFTATLRDLSGGYIFNPNFSYFYGEEEVVDKSSSSGRNWRREDDTLSGLTDLKPININEFDAKGVEEAFVSILLSELEQKLRFDSQNTGRGSNGYDLTLEAQVTYFASHPNGKVRFFFNETTCHFFTKTVRFV
jgi:hypothetical protein